MPGTPKLILHHYASSPFAEKVRLALGLKRLPWASVEVSPMPPRPLLDALTGGYRRIPVLQVGADIYCDTNIILPALERLYPESTLYPDAPAALVKALSFNWERSVWFAAIGVRVSTAKEDAPAAFLRDREEDYLYFDMSKAAMDPLAGRNVQQMRAQLAWLTDTLADGRSFLLGDKPGALDLAYYHVLFLMRSADAQAVDRLLGLAPVLGWFDRVGGLGHGRPTPLSGEDALAEAKAAEPASMDHIVQTVEDLAPGTRVTVTPDDFARVPVTGTLMAAGAHEIVVHHTSVETGDLHLHFPRAGFEIAAA